MKNVAKVMVVLKMTIIVLTLHAMTEEVHEFYENHLSSVNPLEDTDNLFIFQVNDRKPFGCGIPQADDRLCEDKGFPLSLVVIKFMGEPNPVESKKILRTIEDAVGQGIPVQSQYYPSKRNNDYAYGSRIRIAYSQDPVSVFTLIESWSKIESLTNEDKKNTLISAIFQGGYKLEKRLADIYNELRTDMQSKLPIYIPEDIILLILSYDENYKDSKKNVVFIKRAEQKFREEQQS